MKVLLDVGVSPRLREPLRQLLGAVDVETAVYRGWRSHRDDELLTAAARTGFTTLVTTDRRMALEQPHPSIAIVAVDDNRLDGLLASAPMIADAVRSTPAGGNLLVEIAGRADVPRSDTERAEKEARRGD